jgi:hypothetical protein
MRIAVVLVIGLALLGCWHGSSGPTFSTPIRSAGGMKAASVLLVGMGILVGVAAATGNLAEGDDGVGNSTGARVGCGALGVGLVGIGWWVWPSDEPAPAPTAAIAPGQRGQ